MCRELSYVVASVSGHDGPDVGSLPVVALNVLCFGSDSWQVFFYKLIALEKRMSDLFCVVG